VRSALRRRRVAAQRDDVTHTGLPVTARNLQDFLAGRAHAREVRRRRQRGLVEDSRHDIVRALARRPVGAIGHRDEARIERREPLQRDPERALHLDVVRRKELERKRHGTVQTRGGVAQTVLEIGG
jgi:hypothetical protein